MIVECFAGPGGWSEGLRRLGNHQPVVGFENSFDACHTAGSAGHTRVCADVATWPLDRLPQVDGVIASPPCQAWSMTGKRRGEHDRQAVFDRITAYAHGNEPDRVSWADERSALTAEPMRWITGLWPRWVALEQVPGVASLFTHCAWLLRQAGYSAWSGVVSAERFGVPQTRQRAILLARRDGIPAGPPVPTHQAYRQQQHEPDLFGELLPRPVSMGHALGWGLPDRPAWTVTAGGTGSGGPEVFGNARCRAELDAWVLRSNYTDNGEQRTIRESGQPAVTVTGKPGHWVLRNNNQANACARGADEPAGTLFFGQRANQVDFEHGQQRRRVSIAEAGVLQGFPSDYPWQGGTSSRYEQVGNAVPPPLAAAVLRPLLGVE